MKGQNVKKVVNMINLGRFCYFSTKHLFQHSYDFFFFNFSFVSNLRLVTYYVEIHLKRINFWNTFLRRGTLHCVFPFSSFFYFSSFLFESLGGGPGHLSLKYWGGGQLSPLPPPDYAPGNRTLNTCFFVPPSF